MKKFMLITVVAAAMFATPHMHTMNPAANKTAGYYAKLIAKKLTSGTFSTLHWTIAGGTSFLQGIQGAVYLYDENIALKQLQSVDANDQITDFIQSKMRNISSQKIDGVKISPALDVEGTPMGITKKNVIISLKTAHEINNSIITNDQKTLDKWNGTLEHEASHMRHNDLFWRSVVGVAMPFATHGSVRIARNIIPVAKKVRSFGGEQLMKIPTACGKAYITHFARMTINRNQEQRADNEIPNDINLLNGAKATLIELEEKTRENHSNFSPEQYKWKRWTTNFFEPHPLNEVRINKIDQRIALLEKQLSNNS